jgi:hypothetical protein
MADPASDPISAIDTAQAEKTTRKSIESMLQPNVTRAMNSFIAGRHHDKADVMMETPAMNMPKHRTTSRDGIWPHEEAAQAYLVPTV